MTADATPAQSNSINGAFAAYLDERAGTLVQEWMNLLRQDAGVPTSGISAIGLMDHLPFILENLIQHLRNYASKSLPGHAADDSASHGVERWSQGFQLEDLLHEIAHIRGGLIQSLLEFGHLFPHFGQTERLFLHRAVHGFLDRLIVDSAEAMRGSKDA